MASNRFLQFQKKSKASAEVIGTTEFIIKTTKIEGASRNEMVIFENDCVGFIWQINEENIDVLFLEGEKPSVGMLMVSSKEVLNCLVSSQLLGRIVDPLLRPFDNKPEVVSPKTRALFRSTADFSERDLLSDQLETGVILVDTLFAIAKGQRIAVIGDAKAGKSTFLLQTAINQAKRGNIVVLALIAKRWPDVRKQLKVLTNSGVMKNIIIVVSDISLPLPVNYIAPFVAASIAESFWYAGRDVVIMYDDLTNHAKLYREMSLRLGLPSGREAYPGDIFYMHSSLLERAGKLASIKSTLSVLAVGTTTTSDIAGYLSTSLISMTDGQLIFDLETFNKGRKPAINIELSVSRVGGRILSPARQQLSSEIILALSRAKQAEQFSRFGAAESSQVIKNQLTLASRLYEAFNQDISKSYSLLEQQLLLRTILHSADLSTLNLPWLKTAIAEIAKQSIKEDEIESIAIELMSSTKAEESSG